MALLSRAHFENGFLQALAFRYVDASNDYVRLIAGFSDKNRARPGDQARSAISREPMCLVIPGRFLRIRLRENGLERVDLLGNQEQIPNILSAHLLEGIP